MRVLIIGCGYVGLPLGTRLVAEGHEVWGLRRGEHADSDLKAAGVTPLHADIGQPGSLRSLPAQYDWVVNCVAASGGGAESYRRVYLLGTRHVLDWLAEFPPQKFLYTSSTGVYGQNDGSVVTEDSPTEPEPETARILVETEQLLRVRAGEMGAASVILRLAGIYGPGRGYWMQQFLKGEATLDGDGSRILNMVHREDVVGAAIAALAGTAESDVLNVVDDEPVMQRELFGWLSRRLGKPLPPSAAPAQASSRRRGGTNKRVSNAKLKNGLSYRFAYPTFREGYEAELRRLGVPAPAAS